MAESWRKRLTLCHCRRTKVAFPLAQDLRRHSPSSRSLSSTKRSVSCDPAPKGHRSACGGFVQSGLCEVRRQPRPGEPYSDAAGRDGRVHG
jgi:hypothetical protein